jgi:NAD(P)-dependent dehydrogenase (short-subunit alcohol dehydrogenase family)
MVEAAFAETVDRFGGLTILHNNAGGRLCRMVR